MNEVSDLTTELFLKSHDKQKIKPYRLFYEYKPTITAASRLLELNTNKLKTKKSNTFSMSAVDSVQKRHNFITDDYNSLVWAKAFSNCPYLLKVIDKWKSGVTSFFDGWLYSIEKEPPYLYLWFMNDLTRIFSELNNYSQSIKYDDDLSSFLNSINPTISNFYFIRILPFFKMVKMISEDGSKWDITRKSLLRIFGQDFQSKIVIMMGSINMFYSRGKYIIERIRKIANDSDKMVYIPIVYQLIYILYAIKYIPTFRLKVKQIKLINNPEIAIQNVIKDVLDTMFKEDMKSVFSYLNIEYPNEDMLLHLKGSIEHFFKYCVFSYRREKDQISTEEEEMNEAEEEEEELSDTEEEFEEKDIDIEMEDDEEEGYQIEHQDTAINYLRDMENTKNRPTIIPNFSGIWLTLRDYLSLEELGQNSLYDKSISILSECGLEADALGGNPIHIEYNFNDSKRERRSITKILKGTIVDKPKYEINFQTKEEHTRYYPVLKKSGRIVSRKMCWWVNLFDFPIDFASKFIDGILVASDPTKRKMDNEDLISNLIYRNSEFTKKMNQVLKELNDRFAEDKASKTDALSRSTESLAYITNIFTILTSLRKDKFKSITEMDLNDPIMDSLIYLYSVQQFVEYKSLAVSVELLASVKEKKEILMKFAGVESLENREILIKKFNDLLAILYRMGSKTFNLNEALKIYSGLLETKEIIDWIASDILEESTVTNELLLKLEKIVFCSKMIEDINVLIDVDSSDVLTTEHTEYKFSKLDLSKENLEYMGLENDKVSLITEYLSYDRGYSDEDLYNKFSQLKKKNKQEAVRLILQSKKTIDMEFPLPKLKQIYNIINDILKSIVDNALNNSRNKDKKNAPLKKKGAKEAQTEDSDNTYTIELPNETDDPIRKVKSISNDFLFCSGFTMKGLRPSNEDGYTMRINLFGMKQYSFFGVYDGHGNSKISEIAAKTLHEKVNRDATKFLEGENLKENPEVWKQFIEEYDDSLIDMTLEDKNKINPAQGSTVAFAVIDSFNNLVCVNLGDSRVLMCKKGEVVQLSHDHNVNDEEERKRILEAGGDIMIDNKGEYRIKNTYQTQNFRLNLARSLGDATFKKRFLDKIKNKNINYKYRNIKEDIISKTPYVSFTKLDPRECDFIIICCDGPFEVMDNRKLAQYVYKKLITNGEDIESVVRETVEYCIEIGSRDNVTILIIQPEHL